MLKELIGNIPKETGFIKQFRIHQGWWRTFVLNEMEGRYWDKINKKEASVCNRINNGEKTKKNFLSEEILTVVRDSCEKHKVEKSGIIEENRLYNNLLSSQPLAFNFFGFLKVHPDIALAFLRTLRPDIIQVETVVFEYAPKATSDHSAFDFGFIIRSETGRGFWGFECKYTDTFSFRGKGCKVNYGDKLGIEEDRNYSKYYETYQENPYRFPDDYFSYVRDRNFNQLFRNELLAMLLKTEFDFVLTGLFCHHGDKETVKSGHEFQKKIGNGKNDFVVLTYSDYFERIQRLDLTWEQRELIMLLWARYCGLILSQNIFSPIVEKNNDL